MLKWEELSNNEWAAWNEFGYLRADHGEGYAEYESEDVTGKFRAYWDREDAEELDWFDTIDEAKTACEFDYARRVAKIAAANGYVKADDYEAVKKQIDKEVIDSIADAHGRVEQLRDEDFDAIARLKGYVKLEPGQVVVTMTLVYAAKFRMDAEILQGMETNDEAYAEALDIIHKFERIRAARDASGVGR